jgi:multicomponent Na+:H+ antiporter subunit E
MIASNYEPGEKIKSFIYLFILSILTWLALTSNLSLQEVTTGISASLIISLLLSSRYLELGLPPISLKKFVFAIIYIVILFKEIILANFDVAYRVIHPKMPIKPGIVIIKTKLKSDIGKMILANSITLTPGTFVLDIIDDKILIHWINVRTDNTDEATKAIGERFEKYLRVIFS